MLGCRVLGRFSFRGGRGCEEAAFFLFFPFCNDGHELGAPWRFSFQVAMFLNFSCRGCCSCSCFCDKVECKSETD